MSDLQLSAVLQLVDQYLPGQAGKSVRAVLDALPENRFQLKSSHDLKIEEYRAALGVLIGDCSIRFLSIKSLPLYRDTHQVEEYAGHLSGFRSLTMWNWIPDLRNDDIGIVVGESRIYQAIIHAMDERSDFLRHLKIDDFFVSRIAGSIVASIFEDVLQQGAGEESNFPNPLAAFIAAVQWTPLAIVENEVIVLVE